MITLIERIEHMEKREQEMLERVERLDASKKALNEVNIRLSIHTPDVETFQQSRGQIMEQMYQAAAQFAQRNG